MSNLTDTLYELELGLAKYPGDTEADILNVRTVLRQALTEYGNGRYREGYLDGKRDMMDSRSEAERRAEAAGDPR